MTVSPNIGQDYAEQVAAIYRDAELVILRRITDAIADGIDTPTWEADALVRSQRLREAVIAILNQVNPEAAAAIQQAISDAYEAGGVSALRDMGALAGDLATAPAPARIAATTALVRDVATGIDSIQPAILRQTDDLFRAVVARAALASTSGAFSRLDSAQSALRDLARRGIDGIQTARGTMGMSDYLSMSVRTATSRAAIVGSTQTMTANDIDLVVIQPGPRACDICDRWARSVLTIDPGGVAGVVEAEAVDGSGIARIEVDGSLDDARSKGWGHPNCRCAVGAYLPGVTDPAILDRPKWDAAGYEAQQRQRQIERQIRRWKTAEATSITPDERARSAARVADWQQEQRDHLAANDDLKRQYRREQIGRVL